jgi:hypothetical protein
MDFDKFPRKNRIKDLQSWIDMDCDQRSLLNYGAATGGGKSFGGTWAFLEAGVGGEWFGAKQEEEDSEKYDKYGPYAVWLNALRFKNQYGAVMRDGEAQAEWLAKLGRAEYLMLDDFDKLKLTEGLSAVIFALLVGGGLKMG